MGWEAAGGEQGQSKERLQQVQAMVEATLWLEPCDMADPLSLEGSEVEKDVR